MLGDLDARRVAILAVQNKTLQICAWQFNISILDKLDAHFSSRILLADAHTMNTDVLKHGKPAKPIHVNGNPLFTTIQIDVFCFG